MENCSSKRQVYFMSETKKFTIQKLFKEEWCIFSFCVLFALMRSLVGETPMVSSSCTIARRVRSLTRGTLQLQRGILVSFCALQTLAALFVIHNLAGTNPQISPLRRIHELNPRMVRR
ncbi:hypothetical protein TNCT_366701 [Trichonephila clavata]|uniref:Uncharacterized protein n=1 Tax=Trichonephila clavata TaxID=2740835 RepID=A0A8X6FQG7_TRICU|nr:hypothetical protein TNCT_218431 [Trichonephila clavata]GFQ85976.1 hypothetical protein TNCT_366701 [Trichonephila clavata]